MSTNGELYLWGYKRLIGGDITNNGIYKLPEVNDAKAFSIGWEHFAYVNESGQVYTLGKNGLGQLGIGYTGETETEPQLVEGLTNVVDVSADKHYTIALKEDGTVWGWGENNNNVLGSGQGNVATPRKIQGLSDIIAISSSEYNSVALKADGSVYTWGRTQIAGNKATPYKIPGLNLFDGKKTVRVTINDVLFYFDQPAVTLNGSALVPLRGIFEAIGADVKYEAKTEKIRATKDGDLIELTVDSDTAFVNGQKQKLKTPAIKINGRTMVPLRFISEALGGTVEWDAEYRIAKIYNK